MKDEILSATGLFLGSKGQVQVMKIRKPQIRLRADSNLWECGSSDLYLDNFIGRGTTPKLAYNGWRKCFINWKFDK